MMYIDRLYEKILQTKSLICLGLDPFVKLMPENWKKNNRLASPDFPEEQELFWVRKYLTRALENAKDRLPVVKAQSAFFEAYGWRGNKLMEELILLAREMGFLVIADVKRGDIGSTAAAYAQAFFPLADAVTVNPYMGFDSVEAFIQRAQRHGGGLYVLARTSNPSSVDFQNIRDENKIPLYEHVASKISDWGDDFMGVSGLSGVGAVVGATWPEEGKKLRHLMPKTPFLMPGYGIQGGTLENIVSARGKSPHSLLVNSSRGLLYAWKKNHNTDCFEALNRAIDAMNEDLSPLLK
jgi:orotidine-5'-phosphate decarboxylase